MSDSRAVLRVVDEMLWALRRAGFPIATSQAIDAVRAIEAVGLGDRATVRDAVASVVVQRGRDRARFDAVMDAFFAAERAARGTIWENLAARGFTQMELAELKALFEQLAAVDPAGHARLGTLLGRGPELDRALQLAGVTRTIESASSPLQLGFVAHKVLGELGTPQAHVWIGAIRARLVDALGDRGDALAEALKAELARAGDEVREHVRQTFARRASEVVETASDRRADIAAFTTLNEAEIDEVRRAVAAFVERLRGGEQVRRKRAKKGRIDPHKTMRRAMRTGGVPMVPARRARRRDKPRLVLLCDVSDSVRSVARFLLELVYAAHELFDRTRSFVFVSELGETTQLFDREPASVALGHAYGGSVVSVTDNSNYGRALRMFEAKHLRSIDRRTTVAILGDGRTNFHDAGAEVLDKIRARARALVWLCPEARGQWASGDSAMPKYAPKCTRVLEVRCARELEDAARLLVALR